jgi:hypothetical protein
MPLRPLRTVVIVLGARSGTSALAGMLGLLGCTLPKNIMAANWANPRGYFEPQDIADLHDELLASVGSCWSDCQDFPRLWFKSAEAAAYQARLKSIFCDDYGEANLCVLKEPRMCRLLPLWASILSDLKMQSVFCFVDRHPFEVASSLQARDGSSLDQGLRYYIQNHLAAEVATRAYPRIFLSYQDLLIDWRRAAARISVALRINFPLWSEREGAIDHFVERGLRHHCSASAQHLGSEAYKTAASIHSAFRRLSFDALDPAALATLDLCKKVLDRSLPPSRQRLARCANAELVAGSEALLPCRPS